MVTIEIKNIGPIKAAKFNLNTINVFMGPQSSGKSTIAKLISYCTWVEKDVATSQSLKVYQDNKSYFKEHLEKFHKIKGYFNPDSYISYKSEVIEIKYENEVCVIDWVDQYVYKRSKISYIPSERNMISIPGMEKFPFEHFNIRSFLFDWFDARRNYPNGKQLSVLNLGVAYYNDDNGILKEDRIHGVKNNKEYDIPLSNASSGLQSIIPLLAMIDYLTNWIYKEVKISFEQQVKSQAARRRIVIDKIFKPYFKFENIPTEENIKEYEEIVISKINEDKKLISLLEEGEVIQENLFTTHNSQFIIEEPEQNLFPETQRDLVYHLLNKCLNKEGNRLTIATHSPYVLYALNNCMLGGLVSRQLQGEENAAFLSNNYRSKDSWIDPQFVSVWEIEEDGTIRGIQDKDNIIAENYFDIKMTELTDEYYQILNYYQDEEYPE
ncbi:MAG: ATP-binding protein [Candidatus Symbiothrix sp.]|jgi:predicted ATPase|nr:ATP-binding protein [Candidatus Symbiothrix sp.]